MGIAFPIRANGELCCKANKEHLDVASGGWSERHSGPCERLFAGDPAYPWQRQGWSFLSGLGPPFHKLWEISMK